MQKESFVLYTEYMATLEALTDDEVGKLMRAVFAYAQTGEQIKLPPVLQMAFAFIRNQMDRDNKKWQTTRALRAEAGRKGGQRRAQNAQANDEQRAKTKAVQTKQAEQAAAGNSLPAINDTDAAGHQAGLSYAKPCQANQAVYVDGNGYGYEDENVYENGEGDAYEDAPVPAAKRAAPAQGSNSFLPPSLEDVASYCKERNNQIEPTAFLDYYTAGGWQVGGSPMQNWRAMIRRWERLDEKKGAQNVASEKKKRVSDIGERTYSKADWARLIDDPFAHLREE